jgi:hypothetical protein
LSSARSSSGSGAKFLPDLRAVLDAQENETSLANQIDALDVEINKARQRLAAARDKVEREAESKLRAEHAETLAAAIPAYVEASRPLTEALKAVSAVSPSAGPLADAISKITTELATAAEVERAAVSSYATTVLAGGPIYKQSAPVKVVPVAPKKPIERRTLYVFQSSKWMDDGEVKCTPAFSQAEVPVAIAKRAIANNLACDFNSDRAATIRATHGVVRGPTSLDLCVDLETGAPNNAGPKYFDEQSGQPVLGKPTVGVASVQRNW